MFKILVEFHVDNFRWSEFFSLVKLFDQRLLLTYGFRQVAKRLDKNSDLCECVRDMDSNGLAKYLQLTAFQIRYPGITSGNKTITDACEFMNMSQMPIESSLPT